jgi:predicted enzyme related to lactoylglutathione lyase
MGVLGIGGLFFRARDPDMLTAWYRDNLNVGAGCTSTNDGAADEWSWMAEGGPVVFSPFKEDTDYFPRDKSYMLNLRVRNLTQFIAELNNRGIEVITNEEWNDPNVGRFARLNDPEGNPIELWEPPIEDSPEQG